MDDFWIGVFGIKYVIKFKINQMFDKDNEYDLFICSVCFALSDLVKVNQEIHKAAVTSEDRNSSFCFRLNMGFAREAYELLRSKFNNPDFRSKYLQPIDGAVDKFHEIDNIINGETELQTLKNHPINKNRHLIFHYPKEKRDYELIHEVLISFERDDIDLEYSETYEADFVEQDFDFAEKIQYNILYGLYETSDEMTHEEKLKDLATWTAKIINLMNLLWGDFVKKKDLFEIEND